MGWRFKFASNQDEQFQEMPHDMRVVVGPPCHGFVDQHGEKRVYQTFKVAFKQKPDSPDVADLFQACMKLFLSGVRSAMIFRVLPELTLIEDCFVFYTRFYSEDYQWPKVPPMKDAGSLLVDTNVIYGWLK